LGALLLRGGTEGGKVGEGRGGEGRRGKRRAGEGGREGIEGGRKGKGEDDCYSKLFRP